jgi:hypothetical protein
MEPEQIEVLTGAFQDQLVALLEECAHGRRGLFSEYEHLGGEEDQGWPEADRLRELAMGIQSILAHSGERNALCDEFLDLCTIHGENDPGESRLARVFLARIEKGEVGTATEADRKPW